MSEVWTVFFARWTHESDKLRATDERKRWFLNLCQLQTCWRYSCSIYSAEDKSHQCVVQGGSQRPFIIQCTHTRTITHTHNKHVWDKAIGLAMDRYSMRGQQQVVPGGSRWFQVVLCWPWQDAEMQAGVTHLLMCYHGNGRKENRRAIGHVCVCLCVSLSKVNCCTPLLFTYVLIPILQTPKNKRSSCPSVFFSCCASFIFLNVCDETHRTGPWHWDHPSAVLCSSPYQTS